MTGHEGQDVEYRYSYTLYLTSAVLEDRWLMPRPRQHYPQESDPLPIVQEAVLATESDRSSTEDVIPTGGSNPGQHNP